MQRVMFIFRMWTWVCLNIALIICSTLNDVTEATQASLVGTVYCDTCFRQDFIKSIHFISGASVAVECGGEEVQASGGIPRFQKQVKTDVKGEFRVKLPFSATKHLKQIKGCSVKLISSNEPDCAVAATATSSSIQLKVKTAKNHVFTAGIFTFQPLEQPKLCHMKSRHQNSNDGFNAFTPLPSPVEVVDGLVGPPSRPGPATFQIPPVFDRKQNEMKLHDLDKDDFGYPYLSNQFLPPSLVPFFQNQPPRSDFQPPPPSEFNPMPLQPPPPSEFNPIPLQPPNSFDFNPMPLQPPPPSDFNPMPLQPPPSSESNPVPLQPPPPSEFIPIPLQPPPPGFNPTPLQPPPDSTLDPSQTPPDSTFDRLQPSPPSLIPQLFTPPPSPPSQIPSLDFPPPDMIQATPPPSSMPPPPTLMPPFPPFPFQPGQGLPGMPPPTKKTSSP